jgi:hypothetical protein
MAASLEVAWDVDAETNWRGASAPRVDAGPVLRLMTRSTGVVPLHPFMPLAAFDPDH